MIEPVVERGWSIKVRNRSLWEYGRTRREVVRAHCKALGETWDECRRAGDRAVKVEIRELP
jgi:hypothetical protein